MGAHRLASIMTAGLGLVTMSCSGWIQPGDYKVYKVALQTASQSAGCYYPDTAIPPNEASDTDSSLSSAMWVFTTDTNGGTFLDMGKVSLQGKPEGELYTFSAMIVDVQFDQSDGTGDRHATTSDTNVSFHADGENIDGTVTTTTSYTCEGSTCTAQPPPCVTSSQFSGTQIDNIQLQYLVPQSSVN